MKRTINVNESEPAPLSIRHPLGVDLDLELTFQTQTGVPTNPALMQFVLLPRSKGGQLPFDMELIDPVLGIASVSVSGDELTDMSGYNIELYARRAGATANDPLVVTGLVAKGALVPHGFAYGIGKPTPPGVVVTPPGGGPPGPGPGPGPGPVLDVTPPVILSLSTFSVIEDEALSITLLADEPVTWTISGGADAAHFVLTGALLEFGAQDFETPLDSDFDNVYQVQVRAADLSGNITTQVISVTVINVIELTSLFPEEMIAQAWYQEQLPEGPVASWQSTGVRPKNAVQTNAGVQPSKLAAKGGVMFLNATTQHLTWGTEADAPWLNRWWICIARCPSAALAVGNQVNVFTINGTGGGNGARQPRVMFVPNLMQSSVNDNTTKNITGASAADAATWNVMVGWRRGYSHQAVINGVTTTPVALFGLQVNAANDVSFMGQMLAPVSKADMAIDCIIIGQSELTDTQIDKLVGWAMWRVGKQADLPVGHPYKTVPPSGMEDPTRYEHNLAAWDAWAASSAGNAWFTNRGLAATAPTGYSTVFFDDFINPSVVDDLTGIETDIWHAPAWNTAVGVNATLMKTNVVPSCYPHDAPNHTQSIRLQFSGATWKSGAFTSINKNGQGRTWTKGIFEIRCKFRMNGVDGPIAAPRMGMFPAFWSYGVDHLFWRTRNRLETDFWEYDGLDGSWINVTQHVHPGKYPYTDPGIEILDKNKKLAGYPVKTVTDPDFPGTIDIYDGNFHTWYFQIEDDFTTVVLDGREIVKCPTTPELAAEKYIYVDLAYDPNKGTLDEAIDPTIPPYTTNTYDMVIDYIRVQQKETELAIVPAQFTARAAITGTPMDGETLTIVPNTTGQLQYRWYRDGVPIVTPVISASTDTYVLTAADVGHKFRAHVRNLSFDGRPYSWTAETATIVGIAPPAPAVIDGTGTIGQYLWATGTAPFQWKRAGVNIAGATAQNYLVVTADDLQLITCVDVSGSASNAILGTWVRIKQNGEAAILDIDAVNGRYWYNGARYTEADFIALAWTPAVVAPLASNTAWTTGTEPFPGFDQTQGAMIATGAMTDGASDASLFLLNDNTVSNRHSLSIRWTVGSNPARGFTTAAGAAQTSMQDGVTEGWTGGVTGTLAYRYKANDCWYIGKAGSFLFDQTATMPAITQMKFGVTDPGTALAAGAVLDRVTYFAGNVQPIDIQIILGYDIAYLDWATTENDPVDSRDIFGDGFPAVINSGFTGRTNLYRQQQRGVFTKTAISTATDLVEVEGVCFVDYKGNGELGVVIGDQNPGNLYLLNPDTPGNYTGTWTRTLIRAGRQWDQDVVAITFPGDDRESIVYTWEGTVAGLGGVNKLRWDSVSGWVDTPMHQREGSYGISTTRFANGDLLITARNASNLNAVPGIYRLSLAGVATPIFSNANDWKMATIGDWFGNGNEDVLCHRGGTDIVNEFYLFNSAAAWAMTTVNIGKVLRYGSTKTNFKINNRDVVLATGDGYVEMWAWNGAAWALHRSLQKPASPWKNDDRSQRMNIFRQLPGSDVVWGESLGFRLVAIRSVP